MLSQWLGPAPTNSGLGLQGSERKNIYAEKSRSDWPVLRGTRPPDSRPPAPPHPHPPPPPVAQRQARVGSARPHSKGLDAPWGPPRPAPAAGPPALAEDAVKFSSGDPSPRAYVQGNRTPSPELLVPAAADGRQSFLFCNQTRRSYWACPVPPFTTSKRGASRLVSRLQLTLALTG